MTFFICVPPGSLKIVCIDTGYNFPNLCIPNIIICKPLCYNLHSFELFAYPGNSLPTPGTFCVPLGLKNPRMRNPVLEDDIMAKKDFSML